MPTDLQTLLSTLAECRITLGSSRSGARRLKDLSQIEELLQAVWDDTALLPVEGRFAQRQGGDPAQKATLSLARVIWEHTSDLIAVVGEDGRYLYASPSHHAVLGYMVSYLLAQRVGDIVLPSDQPQLDALLGGAARSGYALQTLRVRHADGRPRWIEVSATRRRVANLCQLMLIGRDVTQRRQAEDALRASEAHTRAMLAAIPDLLLRLGPDGAIQEYVAAPGGVAATVVARAVGCRLQEILPTLAAELDAQIAATLASGGVELREYQCWWPAPGDYEARMVQSEPGMLLVMWRDITERKRVERAEQAERESRERYRQMFEDTAATLLLIDPVDGQIVDANPAACAFYGYDRAALLQLSIGALNPLPARHLREALSGAAEGSWRFFVFQHRLADGQLRDVVVHVSALTVGGRRLLYSIVHDITDRLRAEAERRATEVRLERILAQVPALVWTTDRALVVQSAAGAAFGLLGVAPESLVGRTVADLVDQRVDQSAAEAAHQAALAGRHGQDVQRWGARRFDIQIQPFVGADGAITGCIGVGIDTTRQDAP